MKLPDLPRLGHFSLATDRQMRDDVPVADVDSSAPDAPAKPHSPPAHRTFSRHDYRPEQQRRNSDHYHARSHLDSRDGAGATTAFTAVNGDATLVRHHSRHARTPSFRLDERHASSGPNAISTPSSVRPNLASSPVDESSPPTRAAAAALPVSAPTLPPLDSAPSSRPALHSPPDIWRPVSRDLDPKSSYGAISNPIQPSPEARRSVMSTNHVNGQQTNAHSNPPDVSPALTQKRKRTDSISGRVQGASSTAEDEKPARQPQGFHHALPNPSASASAGHPPGAGERYASTSPSFKRRMTATTALDSAIGLSSPEDMAGVGPPSAVAEYRSDNEAEDAAFAGVGTTTDFRLSEKSPIRMLSQGNPPPPPNSEIQASLQESLRQTLKHGSSAPGSGDGDESHDSTAPLYGPETPGDHSDGKKTRKRNFSNRTKTGCHTCRARKKKCDEGKPTCQNCIRGQFDCGGYGPKPPGGTKISAARPVAPLQSKQQYEPQSLPRPPLPPHGYYDGPPHGHVRTAPHWSERQPSSGSGPELQPLPGMVSHVAPSQAPHAGHPTSINGSRNPANVDARSSIGRETWPRPGWSSTEPQTTYLAERLPPTDYSSIPPVIHQTPEHYTPPDQWGQPPVHQYPRPHTGPGTVVSSRESASTVSSHRTQLPLLNSFQWSRYPSERHKMMTGQPYKHFLDNELLLDRQSCKEVVEQYNESGRGSPAHPDQRQLIFRSIIDPSRRPALDPSLRLRAPPEWNGPRGTVGSRTIVECPFKCEFGYNIHLGDDVVISANCWMQDACEITIGNRTVIGPNVKFYCITASIDPSVRKGSQSEFKAGDIVIEDDCFIGADTIILPFRTIGKGAVVGAGSVITRDVKPNTVVAGNPAKYIRRRIESGPNVDDHEDPAIQQQNKVMLARMQARHNNNQPPPLAIPPPSSTSTSNLHVPGLPPKQARNLSPLPHPAHAPLDATQHSHGPTTSLGPGLARISGMLESGQDRRRGAESAGGASVNGGSGGSRGAAIDVGDGCASITGSVGSGHGRASMRGMGS